MPHAEVSMPDTPNPSGESPLVSQFANDPEMGELVQLFVSELPARLDALSAAWSQRRIADLTRMAHQLKGAGGGYGFPTIGKAAAALECSLRTLGTSANDNTLEQVTQEFKQLVQLCSRASASGR